ncbi:amino acid carrier protein [Candidatus Babeliales bacterium]|nr:amino acid carrier protein [Candidatus Babeliales bacterium]
MLQNLLINVRDAVWGFPLLAFIVGVGATATIGLYFIQFRKFFSSWKLIFAKQEGSTGEISPFNAFLNVLSTSLGNGALAGIAVAIHTGGPGAVFWIFMFGFFAMILRFAEVYLATSFSSISKTGRILGGPFLYLQQLPGGKYLPYIYATMCLAYAFFSGTAMQCNSIVAVLGKVTPLSPWVIGSVLTLFICYTLLGGSQRIIKASSILVPLKVVLFFFFCSGVLLYHWAALPAAIMLIIKAAFNPQAVAGSVAGLSIMRVFSISVTKTVNASEAGLGTAAVIYGSTGSKDPLSNSLTAMLGTFISLNLVCTMVALSIVVSGALASGETGAALTSVAFQSVFGVFGAWVVSLLSVLFGIGVFVAYGFVGRQCWFFLTNDKFEHLFTLLFCAISFWGAVADVSVVWATIDLVNAGNLIINLSAILYLIPFIRAQLCSTLTR